MADLITADMVGKTLEEVQIEIKEAADLKAEADALKPPTCSICLKTYNEKLLAEGEVK